MLVIRIQRSAVPIVTKQSSTCYSRQNCCAVLMKGNPRKRIIIIINVLLLFCIFAYLCVHFVTCIFIIFMREKNTWCFAPLFSQIMHWLASLKHNPITLWSWWYDYQTVNKDPSFVNPFKIEFWCLSFGFVILTGDIHMKDMLLFFCAGVPINRVLFCFSCNVFYVSMFCWFVRHSAWI